MKHLTIAVLTLLLAAGCSDRAPSPEPGKTPAGNAPAAQAPAQAQAQAEGDRQLREPLPEGIALGFRHRVRQDRVVERDDGPDRRQVGLVYLDTDQQSVFAQLDDALVSAGLTQTERRDQDGGTIRAKYRKPGFGRVILTVAPVGTGEEGAAPGEGRVLLDLPAE